MLPREPGETFLGFSQTDVIGRKVAYEWMADRVRRSTSCTDEHEDVLRSDFPWTRFLMGRPWGLELLKQGVTTMTLVSWKGQPAFRFTTNDRPEVRHIRVSGKKSHIVE